MSEKWKHQSQLIFCILRLSYKHIDFDSSQGTPCRYTDMGLPELFHFCQAQPKPKPNPQLGAEIALISQLSWTTHHPPRIVVFRSFRASASSQLVCSLFMTSLDLSWLLLDLFMTCLQLVHNLFMICSWLVYQLVHDLFMTCLQLVHNLFMTYSWLVH